MYLWKYWRETRITFLAILLGIAGAFALVHEGRPIQIEPRPSFAGLSVLVPAVFLFQAVPMIFIAWVFGSFGVGRDLGERSGSYLFSRPRSRAFFVWSDWGLGLAQLLVLAIGIGAVLGLELSKILADFGDPYHGSFLFSGWPVSLGAIMRVNCIASLLLAALIFGLTYFSTVLVKSTKGVILGAGILISYVAFKAVAAHYWPSLSLPDLIPATYTPAGSPAPGFADHLGMSLSLRALVALVFPVAAQLLLQKRDID